MNLTTLKITNLAGVIFLVLIIISCKEKAKAPLPNENASVPDHKIYGTRILIDTVNSVLNWTGSKPTGSHSGTLMFSKGELFTDMDGRLQGGNILIDMKSLRCTDISEEAERKDLEDHLRSADFFNVDSFQYAEFFIDSFKVAAGTNTNTTAYGQLTIKGITQPLEVQAQVSQAENVYMIEVPEFKIDRTRWNINYKSKTIFPNLLDKFIDDQIGIKMKLLGMKQ